MREGPFCFFRFRVGPSSPVLCRSVPHRSRAPGSHGPAVSFTRRWRLCGTFANGAVQVFFPSLSGRMPPLRPAIPVRCHKFPGNFLPHPSQMPFEAYPLNTAAQRQIRGRLPRPCRRRSGPAVPPVSLLWQAVWDDTTAGPPAAPSAPQGKGDRAAIHTFNRAYAGITRFFRSSS